MNKRVKDTVLGTVVYGVIAIIVSAILNGGEPSWTLVIGMAIAGFLTYAFIYPALDKRKRKQV
ncbi:hypothetical protein SAMN04487975_10429 [Planococcus glaciei]|uniref:hypothetical protein n=1 Tax=Planococcus glaciei TaxID=459472 RepID=UPI00088E3070|nr:hypothetical protein [Planococcus glaciei]SDH32297.1 hypothetical protein SAMN04487975_10429 [Planococcus glaciei]